jgi:glycerophosphoryl diester phosphodiesterase
MKLFHLFIFFIGSLFISCEKEFSAPVPENNWTEFNASGTVQLINEIGTRLEGIYDLPYGNSMFGGSVAVKWVWTIEDNDTLFTVSGFFEKDNSYFIASGRRTDSLIMLNGYYRKMINTETGIIRLKIDYDKGTRLISDLAKPIQRDSILFTGNFGQLPNQLDSLVLIYKRPLRDDSDFLILAHRCGGRTSDLLPAAENSINMVLLSSKLGATGIELDVRLTSDEIPVVYHDETLNDRLIIPNGMMGNISNYSFAQIRDLVRLTDGQTIPTLREIMDVVLHQTTLRFVWIDIKYNGSIQQIHQIQQEYLIRATQLNRDLTILLGIPDDDVQNNFQQLPDYINIPSLNERYDEIDNVNSIAWGAPWSLGILRDEVESLQNRNKKVYVWTLDSGEYIEQYISENLYDGILSNYPSTIAYYYYAGL